MSAADGRRLGHEYTAAKRPAERFSACVSRSRCPAVRRRRTQDIVSTRWGGKRGLRPAKQGLLPCGHSSVAKNPPSLHLTNGGVYIPPQELVITQPRQRSSDF